MNGPIDRTISRRNLMALWGGGGALLTASLSGCAFFSTNPEQKGNSVSGGGEVGAKQAPMLAAKVEAGDLEPLEKRLPTNPLVVEVPQAGRYGGTWKSVTLGPGDEAAFARIAGYQPLLRKDPMLTEIVPSLCTDIQADDAATEYTLLLREGVKWSDGHPFGADDIVFAMEDVFANTDLYPSPPSWLSVDGELAKAEKIDDHTAKIIFASATGLFIDSAATQVELLWFPKHYVSKLLPKYNDQLDQDVEDAGYESWTDYFEAQTSRWTSLDLPVLDPWKVIEPLGESERVVLERNPYFWKTDPDGRQLPYIDKLSWEVVADAEVQLLKSTSGELDLVYRTVTIPANKPVLAKGREEGGYELIENVVTLLNTMIIQLNLANKDKDHRELYQNKDFRIGLSHAIDRQELITAVWQRQGEPWQAAPTKDSAYYDEEFAKQYTEFDPDLANEHLDRAGITDKDKQGFRTLPNGKQLTVTLDVSSNSTEWPAAADILKGMWEDVGVRLKVNTIDRTLFYERKTAAANEHDASTWTGPSGFVTEVQDPRCFLPFSDESAWATPWAQWFSSHGKAGTEPVPAAKEQIELYWSLQETPDEAERDALFRQILEIAKEQFWIIGIGTAPQPYMAVSNRLKNLVSGIPETAVFNTPSHANPEMWFLDDQQ